MSTGQSSTTKRILTDALANRKSVIKSTLLDQKVAAGVGNWIADELLFQAKIHPEKRANELTSAEIMALQEAIQLVLRTAIEKEARYAHFPESFLIHARAWDASPYGEDKEQHLLSKIFNLYNLHS